MQLLFPYETIRNIQKELIKSIQDAVKNKQNLIVHAPTGIGKTAAAVSSVLPYALENRLTIFFLTPMHTQHRIAVETLKEIQAKFGIKLEVVDLIGRKNMCLQDGISNLTSGEFGEYCYNVVKNKECTYYNNLLSKNDLSVETKLTLKSLSNVICHTEELISIAKESDLCPYETACIHAQRADVIILDYMHLLDPGIRDQLLKKTSKRLYDSILIFDEAHKLPERCREVMSEKLNTFVLEMAARESQQMGHKEIADDLRDIADVLFKLSKMISIDKEEILISKKDFYDEVKNIGDYKELINNFTWIADRTTEKKKKSFCSSVADFLKYWPGKEEGFARILMREFDSKGKPVVTISYNCLDPSIIMKELAYDSYSTICMSGTLTPTSMYKDLFGFESETKEFSNPFPPKNKLTLIIPETTTKFTARSSEMYMKIADHCSKIINSVPGNTAVFFPSYRIRDDVLVYLEDKCSKTPFLETKGISKEEKNDLIDKFKSCKDTGAVLLGASSGNFGEGLDLAGDFLKAVVVVGLPLAKPNLKTQKLIEYYDLKFGKGWEYGYTLPAIIKTKQNAGRCIRSETDKGIIAYLDIRYTWNNYFKAFEKEENLKITKEPAKKINEFFS